MIRTTLTADGQLLQIKLPADFVGKLIEVIAFPVQETTEPSVTSQTSGEKKITVVSVLDKHYKFNREELHER